MQSSAAAFRRMRGESREEQAMEGGRFRRRRRSPPGMPSLVRHFEMKILLAILVAVVILLQIKMWFGEGGYRDVQRLAERVEEQARENEMLAQRNLELQAEVDDLRQGLQAIEERARSELGMVKDDEEFYQVIPGRPNSPDQPD
jgi:cell division protein FtsB